jgi:hypothetical protein
VQASDELSLNHLAIADGLEGADGSDSDRAAIMGSSFVNSDTGYA